MLRQQLSCPVPGQERHAGQEGEEKQLRGLASFLRLWREPEAPVIRENTETFMNVEFSYSLEELNRQDEEHKQPRRDLNSMPDLYSISNTLRAVGGVFRPED